MSEIGLVEYFGMEEAIGLVATLFVIYFSRKQMQSLGGHRKTRFSMTKDCLLSV